MKNRIVCGVMFSLAALLATPAAQAQLSYTTNADNVSLTIIGYAGPPWAVVIPTNINGLTVISIGDRAFSSTGVINVSISDTVTNIGEEAFFRCESLTSVIVGANVASIGDGAFASCSSLTNINIPGSVTSIGVGAFIGCSNLPNVTIPAGVTNIGPEAFAAILNIAAYGVLGRCASLTAINVDAQNAFYSSSNGVLFDKSVSTLIQYPGAMGGNYTIPGSVTSIQPEAFCATALTGVAIPGSVTNFGQYAFGYCASLTNVTMANGVTGLVGDSSLFVFEGCSSLSSITIPGSVTNIADDEFADCISLASVFFQGNAPEADSSFAADLFATAYYLPGTTGWSAFSANTGLPAVLWNPVIQTADGSFDVRANQFGFNITGTPNIPIVVQGADDLANPVWTSLQSVTLTNGLYYFSEPFQPARPARFYRITSQ